MQYVAYIVFSYKTEEHFFNARGNVFPTKKVTIWKEKTDH